MDKLNYFLSTDVTFGIGVFKEILESIKNLNCNHPAVIYDKNLSNNDYCMQNIDLIKRELPICSCIANQLNGEPTYKYLEDIRLKFQNNTPDIIIAIGGGSTMDLGKGVALLLKNNVSSLSLKGFPENINDPLPLITVPSIFGSGSEVSFNAVFIDEDEGKKLGINSRKNFPRKTLMDPLLTMSAPQEAVISSAMDTLVHCVDSFGSKNNTFLSKIYSVAGFQKTFTALRKLDLSVPESRLDLAIGSVLGITALMNSGDGPTNGFAYYFGVKNKIPHGLAGGIFLKEVMLWNYQNGFLDYSKLVENEFKGSVNDQNEYLFSELNSLYKKFSIPNLSSYGYSRSDISNLAKQSSEALSGSFNGNPVKFDKNSAEKILSKLI